jgi:serine/threonine-protein kinase
MGEVYLAHDDRLNRAVALKRLSDASLTTEAVRRRVLHEARAAAALSHPNIATIFDVLDTGAEPAIVMEYVPGESLARQIARGPLPAGRALEIAVQISDALVEAHGHGVIHRDLKPANVQITPSGKAKILDFGIARSVGDEQAAAAAPTVSLSSEAGRIVGTPGYMAPEQLLGGTADKRTDIYALGVLLYEMLTGRRPFESTDILKGAIAAVAGGAPRVIDVAPHVPPYLSAIVERAMAKDPADRFQTAGELSADLQRAWAQVGTGSHVAPPHQRTSTIERRFRLHKKALTTVLALAGAVAVAAIWQWTRRPVPVPSTQASVIAVLPFKNSTADPANDPIARGVTEAVANALASVRSIRVLSLEDSRNAARGTTDAARAARNLGAGFAVDGQLRRSGQTLDVEVSLVNANGQRQAAGPYPVDASDAFALYRQINEGLTTVLAQVGAVSSPTPAKPAPPTSNQEAFAEYVQARLFLERPDVPSHLDHAITLFQSAIEKDQKFALAYAGLGQAYWAQYSETQAPEWPTKATKAILDALRIDPDQPEVRISLAIMYQGLGRADAAREELQKVMKLQPQNDDAHRLLAGIDIHANRLDDAIAELHKAIALRPNYWRNHSELGYAYYRAGRMDDAIAAYQRVVDLQPDSARGFHMLGTVYQSAGRLDDALANYAKANAINPSAGTYSNIGTIRFWAHDYTQAAEAYAQAISRSPNEPDLYANLGDAQQKLGQRAKARASYRTAVEKVRGLLAVNENDALNQSLLALYLAKLSDRPGAEAAIQKALTMTPQDAEVLYSAAVVDALAGKLPDACTKLEAALARGASVEIVRRADEIRVLKGCPAYDRVGPR